MKRSVLYVLVSILVLILAAYVFSCGGGSDDDTASEGEGEGEGEADGGDIWDTGDGNNKDAGEGEEFNNNCNSSDSPVLNSCAGEFLDCFRPNGTCQIVSIPSGLGEGEKVEFLNNASITYKKDGSGEVRMPEEFAACATFTTTGTTRTWKKVVIGDDGEQTETTATQEFELNNDGSYKSQKWTCPDGSTVEFKDMSAKDICVTAGYGCTEAEQ